MRVVANAGGMNPLGCKDAVLEVARAAGDSAEGRNRDGRQHSSRSG